MSCSEALRRGGRHFRLGDPPGLKLPGTSRSGRGPVGARLESEVDWVARWGGRLVRGRPPWSAFSFVRKSAFSPIYPCMAVYRRRLPHDYETDQPVFLIWRLHDSLPCHRAFPSPTVTSGQAFAAMDRLLDEARSGPFYLRQPRIAHFYVAPTGQSYLTDTGKEQV
jgi:hypothetical protein